MTTADSYPRSILDYIILGFYSVVFFLSIALITLVSPLVILLRVARSVPQKWDDRHPPHAGASPLNLPPFLKL